MTRGSIENIGERQIRELWVMAQALLHLGSDSGWLHANGLLKQIPWRRSTDYTALQGLSLATAPTRPRACKHKKTPSYYSSSLACDNARPNEICINVRSRLERKTQLSATQACGQPAACAPSRMLQAFEVPLEAACGCY